MFANRKAGEQGGLVSVRNDPVARVDDERAVVREPVGRGRNFGGELVFGCQEVVNVFDRQIVSTRSSWRISESAELKQPVLEQYVTIIPPAEL